MLLARVPKAIVVGVTIVVVNSLALHLSGLDLTVINLAIRMHVNSLTIKLVFSPSTEVDVCLRIVIYSFAVSQFLGAYLSEVLPSVRVVYLRNARKAL
jgi:hypothetical protein